MHLCRVDIVEAKAGRVIVSKIIPRQERMLPLILKTGVCPIVALKGVDTATAIACEKAPPRV